ncbi:3-isopropylmalate dehydrogenase [Rhodothalassium salexigens]|uniref:3-isopropylmalate dehydrogenase n=1 Tax=Rhodothalassium salexigens TaxID=1086 RepID=UPI001912002A|nr:3-isopropylmalate dehydrogenase [Rhodothalassium salexigens]MBK5920324.1 3-isopropylmalate dehydrogenase [Rhodothalassium salexigens]
MSQRIVLLPGDGIGPEVCAAGRHVLDTLAPDLGVDEHLIGGAAVDATGIALPQKTLDAIEGAQAVLLGAVGGPQWADQVGASRPEAGLLALRRHLGVYANLRPIVVRPGLAQLGPIKPEISTGADILFVRELTGGLYFGDKGRTAHNAYDNCQYSKREIERVVRMAANLARDRRGKLTLVDKANVLETSRLWREVTQAVIAEAFPDVTLECLLVDAAAMHLLTRPRDFDVVVTENLFGDILTDEASVLAGALGVIPSASLGDGDCGLYEPIHGSAPDIAGQDKANPLGLLESLAMLLDLSLGRADAAGRLRAAIAGVIDAGVTTADLGGEAGTHAVAEAVCQRL